MQKRVAKGTWAREAAGDWKIKIDPNSVGRTPPGGKILAVQVTKRDGTIQHIQARVDGVVKTKNGRLVAITASPVLASANKNK